MDATQKQRIRKVAINHFRLTLVFVLLIFAWIGGLGETRGGPFNPDFIEHQIRHEIWLGFWLDLLKILQMLPFLIVLIFQQMQMHSFLPECPFWFAVPIFCGVLLAASFFWSFCFGWIFIRVKDWLNHFPVLGKRVF